MTSCLNVSPSAGHMVYMAYFVYFFLLMDIKQLKTGLMYAEEPENN